MKRWELVIAWWEKNVRLVYENVIGKVGSDSSCYE